MNTVSHRPHVIRPHVILSAAMSLDGCLDDATPERLMLSDAEDFDRVDELRAHSDAIMVGAETIRRDNPRLLVNDAARRAARVAKGESEYPLKVTVTGRGELGADAKFFTTGGAKLVYCATGAVEAQAKRLGDAAEVGDAGDPPDFGAILDDLGRRGVRRLMVEGGTSLHTRFLAEGLADEIQVAIAPFLVGDPRAPRFTGPAAYPQDKDHRMRVAETRAIGDLVFVRYLIDRAAS
jgi:5-amino-6-(5-phosphoribosylamino)uracil reductase